MREKHYRVWDKENKTMGYARDLLHVAGMFRELYDACEPGETFPDGYVLMEGIGLKDKNGKEIFGGDIIRHENDDISVGTIVYKECYFEIQFQSGNCNFITTEKIESFGIEVIGNIYENPNLLSQDK